jgi:hypothetical protein
VASKSRLKRTEIIADSGAFLQDKTGIKNVIFAFYINILDSDVCPEKARPRKPSLVALAGQLLDAFAVGFRRSEEEKHGSARTGIPRHRTHRHHSHPIRRAFHRATEQDRARAGPIFHRAEYLSRLGVVRRGDLSGADRDCVLAWAARDNVFEFRLAVFAFLCITLSLVVFFTFVYPGNVATANWTTVPENWAMLRRHWEYGHAMSAILTFVAFCALVLGAVARR